MALEPSAPPVADDPYSDGDAPEPEEVEQQETENPETKPKDDGAATELLSKSFFGDKTLKPGTRCEVEIVKITDSQAIVKTVPESDYDDEPDKEKDLMDDD